MVAAIWLVRHAPVEARGICYGQSDVPVTIAAARAAAEVVHCYERAAPPCTEVWSSPWSRTREVAERIAATFRCPHRIDARLSELSFGTWEGRSYAAIEREEPEPWASFMRDFATERPPGGETVPELRARVGAWLEERRL